MSNKDVTSELVMPPHQTGGIKEKTERQPTWAVSTQTDGVSCAEFQQLFTKILTKR